MTSSQGRGGERRGRVALTVLNGVGIASAAAFASRGVQRPSYVGTAEPATRLAEFWAASSAVRTWALAAPLAVALSREKAPSRSGLLVVAGLVQCGDAILGLRQRNPAMTIAPGLMGVVHLLTARAVRD